MKKQTPSDLLATKYRQIVSELDSIPTSDKTPFKTKLNVSGGIFDLTYLLSSIITRRNSYKVAARLLNTDPMLFKYQGYSYEDSIHDIKLQISIIQNRDRRQYLLDLKSKLEPFLNKDQQIEELLSSLGI